MAASSVLGSGFQSHAGSIEASGGGGCGSGVHQCFNPTLVRLRRSASQFSSTSTTTFQSHAGSIEARTTMSASERRVPFQSHAGSIEAGVIRMAAVTRSPSFNPTLVRLRLDDIPRLPGRNHKFQSHAGSIEAPGGRRVAGRDPEEFQSHAGSIEARDHGRPGRRDRHRFNPTLVRLRPGRALWNSISSWSFNPTLVRLRREITQMGRRGNGKFQSHAGSIEAKDPKVAGRSKERVSIPRWFD